MEGILSKVMVGTGLLIAVYLILTNPNGTSTAANSLSTGYVSGVKALQGR